MSTPRISYRLATLAAAFLLMLGTDRLQATPLIFAQPTNANAFVGDASASFKVIATGDATLSYHWQMQPGSSGGFSDISGATTDTLSLSNPTLAMNGYQYRCVLTCTGTSTGTLTSAVTTLNVYAAPTLTPTVTLSTDTIAANSTDDITIHITGLNSGDAVRIQRFLDSNGNGSVDPGEPLAQSFSVTDGVVNSIGGVTNTSVPRDEDSAANGSITTHFSLPSTAEMGRTAGSYLIRVISRTGGFRPVQKPFTITQPAYSQSISGQVLAGAIPVPYALVALNNTAGNGEYAASAVANASGNYTISVPVGNYQVLVIQSGYVNQVGAPTLSLGAGQALTGRNPAIIAATCTISGQVQDASTHSLIRGGGIQLEYNSDTHYFAVAMSDSNGNYVISAVPDGWSGDLSQYSMAALGYMRQPGPPVTTTSGNVTSQNLQSPAVTALLGGTVRNSSAAVMPGIIINASMPSNESLSGVTDANGNFTIGVSGGTWSIQLDSTQAASNHLIGTNLQQTVASGQGISGLAIQIATGTGTLSGYVQDESGQPVSTGVSANATISGMNYFSYADTDSSGNYSFPVINGLWNVSVSQSGYTQQSVQVSGTSQTLNFTPPVIVAHLQGTVTKNGITVSGASIGAGLQGGGNTWISTTTDASGNFDIGVTSNGTWYVRLESNYADANYLVGPNLTQIVSNNQSISNISYPVVGASYLISGVVQDSNGLPVTTMVFATTTLYGVNYYVQANTDNNGLYILPVIDGAWIVGPSMAGYGQQIVNVTGVNFTASSPFQQWRQTYFSTVQLTNAGLSGIAAPVVSGAGYTNEIAYALGLDPRVAKVTDLPVLGKTSVLSISYQTLGFNRNLAASDLTYQVQVSSDLISWTPLSTFSGGAWSPSNIVIETPSANPNLKQVQVRDSVPLNSPGKRFLRLVAIHS